MENLVFAILMLGCDHTLEACENVPTPIEFYASREACEEILPLAFHEADTHPIALGDCVAVPEDWIEKDIVFEWSVDQDDRLKIAVRGADNTVFGDPIVTKVASGKTSRMPAG